MLASARCTHCDGLLPLRGGLLDFRLPPEVVTCPACGKPCPSILAYRVGWMEAWLHKVLLGFSAPGWIAWIVLGAADWRDWALATGCLVVAPWLAAKLLGTPLTVLRDARRRRS